MFTQMLGILLSTRITGRMGGLPSLLWTQVFNYSVAHDFIFHSCMIHVHAFIVCSLAPSSVGNGV